jgi:hypothetical protein
MGAARDVAHTPPSEDGARRVRQNEATISLAADAAAVLDFEAFVDGLGFLGPRERGRVKLAGDEILDNLVRHASPLRDRRITVRAARRSSGIFLAFFFRSPTFASFAVDCGGFEPLFDPADRRWRGIGLVMCYNLSRDIVMRPGTLLDRIFLSFSSDPDATSPSAK